MTTPEQKQKYIEELKWAVEHHPKNYTSYINCRGFKGRNPDRQYLRDFIAEQTPLLSDPKFTLPTKIYWIINGITSWDDPRVRCEQCGKPFNDRNIKKINRGYVRFCSRSCMYSSSAVQEKIQKTCMEKYGVINTFMIPAVIEDLKRRKADIQKKKDETRRLNHSFNLSRAEKNVGEYLKNLYPDLVCQYSSDSRYPFNCDYYSPQNDLFIEFNGCWTHGGRFFDPSDDFCLKQLDEWKQKAESSPFYVNAIETWTVRDVTKRKCAEENHLNYLVFWNMDEVMKYLNDRGFIQDYLTPHKKNPVTLAVASKMYDEHGLESFYKYVDWDFPYPEISDSQLEWEIEALPARDLSDKQFSPIIRKFHQSIWHCNKENQISPVDYWEYFKGISSDNWKKFYINRIQHAGLGCCDNGILKPHAIRYGFDVLHYSNCVSYLKPALAKRLIQTHLSEFSTIFCPMNGFSGFMLGSVLGCNKNYLGQDISKIQIKEAQEIADWLLSKGKVREDQIRLSVRDMFDDNCSHDCLIACPPYNLKEMWNFDYGGNPIDRNMSCNDWIKAILDHYDCRRYLFVVDDSPTEFDECVVEFLGNRSHFGRNREKVIVLDRAV